MRKDSEGVTRHPELAGAMDVKCSAEISLGSYMELKESNEEVFTSSVKKHVVTVESIQMGCDRSTRAASSCADCNCQRGHLSDKFGNAREPLRRP